MLHFYNRVLSAQLLSKVAKTIGVIVCVGVFSCLCFEDTAIFMTKRSQCQDLSLELELMTEALGWVPTKHPSIKAF